MMNPLQCGQRRRSARRGLWRSIWFLGFLAALAAPAVSAAAKAPTIVLIGGATQGYPPGEHDYADGVLKIERMIRASPQFADLTPTIKVFPTGFPTDLTKIDDADVVLLYFGLNYKMSDFKPASGGGVSMTQVLEGPPLLEMKKLMARGVGVIALHQASTVPDRDSASPLKDWLGGVRIGMADRSTEAAPVEIAGSAHPIARGLQPFVFHDEYYPTITFSTVDKVTPILSAKVHVQFRDNKAVFEDPASPHVIAWAAERPDGGRAFVFTGAHYLASFDRPQIAAMLLNALLWTSKHDVPAPAEVSTAGRPPSDPPAQIVMLPASAVKAESPPWGKLEWFASRALGNSTTMTVGRATIRPGLANPVHWHPNCDEILHVVQGHIMHRVGDHEYEMHAGDTVTIPEGTLHNARNIGSEDAILDISFSSADRVAIGEDK